MKKVKFNASAGVHMIPDEQLAEYMEIAKLRRKDPKAYKNLVEAGSEFEIMNVKIGEVVEVPDHYYARFKDTLVAQGESFDKYIDREGNRLPYNQDEALRHGDIKETGISMKKVKLFELVK